MTELSIATVVILALCFASLKADRRFRNADRLPMQWSLAGEVNWTAPRRLALSFTPALASVILIAIALTILLSGHPRPGQEGLGVPIVLLVGLVFVGVHAMHLRLISRSISCVLPGSGSVLAISLSARR